MQLYKSEYVAVFMWHSVACQMPLEKEKEKEGIYTFLYSSDIVLTQNQQINSMLNSIRITADNMSHLIFTF